MDAVSQPSRFAGVVGHQQDGPSQQKFECQLLHLCPRVCVQRGKRLVQQNERPVFCERAGERRALPLPAREGRRSSIFKFGEADAGDQTSGMLKAWPFAPKPRPRGYVGEDAAPRKEEIALGHVGYASCNGLAVARLNLPLEVRVNAEPGDQPQKR